TLVQNNRSIPLSSSDLHPVPVLQEVSLVLLGLFPFVRDHLCSRWCRSCLARTAPRFGRHIQFLFLPHTPPPRTPRLHPSHKTQLYCSYDSTHFYSCHHGRACIKPSRCTA